ncbi:Citrate synthase 3, peroxisomal [Asimina triloba]
MESPCSPVRQIVYGRGVVTSFFKKTGKNNEIGLVRCRDSMTVCLVVHWEAIKVPCYCVRSACGMKSISNESTLRIAYALIFTLPWIMDAGTGGDSSYKPNPRLARVLDILFILHAEHEMNCSTAAARHLASSGVDVYTALAGAVGALYGPLHGGANEAVLKMLSEIGTVENIPAFIDGVKNRKRKMSGFGHRVYKNYDPRAKVIRKLAEEVFSIVGRDPLIEVAVALEKAALSDEYFVKRKLYPNVDFYSGLIYRAMGFPTEFFPVLFAVPRMAGYLSHWRESLDDPDTKIMRPQQVYTGVWRRHYTPLQERLTLAEGDKLGQVAVSNATKRRLAGRD